MLNSSSSSQKVLIIVEKNTFRVFFGDKMLQNGVLAYISMILKSRGQYNTSLK